MDILLVLIVILIIVLIWRGPQMLPQFGEALGRAVKGARDTMDRDAEPADDPAAKADQPTTTAEDPAAAKADDDSQTRGQ